MITTLIKRIIIALVIIMATLTVQADIWSSLNTNTPESGSANISMETENSNSTEETYIDNISYEYTLTTSNEIDCFGTLSFTIHPAAGGLCAIVRRTTRHSVFPDSYSTSYLYMINDESEIDVILDSISWDIRFKVETILSDDSRQYTPDYSVKSFIKPEDLDILQSYVDAVELKSDQSPTIEVINGILTVNSPEQTHLNITKTDGTTIFSGQISEPISLSVNSGLHIISYIHSNQTITKKILVK